MSETHLHRCFDGGGRLLYVGAAAGGVKAFVFTKFKHGRLTRITLGRAGALRLDSARRAAQALHGQLALGAGLKNCMGREL
jgi:hypothetical protein